MSQYTQTLDTDITVKEGRSTPLGAPFYLMPQTLNEVQISISFNGKNLQCTLPTAEWQEGKRYVYTLDLDEEVFNANAEANGELTYQKTMKKLLQGKEGVVSLAFGSPLVRWGLGVFQNITTKNCHRNKRKCFLPSMARNSERLLMMVQDSISTGTELLCFSSKKVRC